MPREQIKKEPYIVNAGTLGWLEGVTITSSSSAKSLGHYFGGVPYALPPVEQYRFRQARSLPDHFKYGTKRSPGRYTTSTAVCPQPGWPKDPDETSWDENCLQLNISIPARSPPTGGFPVFFYIHGGFLQWGSPNMEPAVLASLQSETAFNAIIVAPAYRVNAFGFLVSRELQAEARLFGEPAGNQGFWDQRLALEWTAKNIGAFGGNGKNINIAGYSAGAHSVFHQLSHELYFVPSEEAIIKRAIMWSNGSSSQPKVISEHQQQFNELLKALGISSSLSASQKLVKLRAVPPHDLISAQNKLKLSEFRAFSDGVFIDTNLFSRINSGDFAKRMLARGIQLMNGECRDEHSLYRTWRTPAPSYDAVFARLCADYPAAVVQRLMHMACGVKHTLPYQCQDWQEAFGRLYANMQVHGLERGFHDALVKGGLKSGQDLFRYRFDWRTKACDSAYPPEWGVTHSTDMDIWFWGMYGEGLSDEEKEILKTWNEALAAFVQGRQLKWPTNDVKQMLRLREDGKTDVWTDDRWEEGLKIWDAVNGQHGPGVWSWIKSKL